MFRRRTRNGLHIQVRSFLPFFHEPLRHASHRFIRSCTALEHRGLNRFLDVGLDGYRRYVGYGVLSYNLHRIGRELLARARTRSKTARASA